GNVFVQGPAPARRGGPPPAPAAGGAAGGGAPGAARGPGAGAPPAGAPPAGAPPAGAGQLGRGGAPAQPVCTGDTAGGRQPFGLTFHEGYLYVAYTDCVVRYKYQSGDTQA